MINNFELDIFMYSIKESEDEEVDIDEDFFEEDEESDWYIKNIARDC